MTTHTIKQKNQWIWLLIAIFFCKELLWSYFIPPWQAPDELGHYGYIETLSKGDLPLLGETKIAEKIENTVNDPYFVRAYKPGEGLNYIAQHPPLYYLLLTPFYLVLQQNNPAITLIILRCIGILLGAGTLFFAHKIVQKIMPAHKWFQIAVVAGIAFLPMFSYTIAVLNNDNLVAFIASILIFLLVNQDQNRQDWPIKIGVIFGLAALTKYTALILVFGIISVQIMAFLHARNHQQKMKAITNTIIIFLITFLIAGWWYIRNIILLKSLFPELKQAVNVYPEILTHYSYLAVFFPEIKSNSATNISMWTFIFKNGFFLEYYKSIWGNFGKFILSQIQYIIIFFISSLSVLGFIKSGISSFKNRKPKIITSEKLGTHILFSSLLISISFVLTIKLFEIAQGRGVLGALNGRYFFSALIPFFYFFILGLSNIVPLKWRKYESHFLAFLIILFAVNDLFTIYNIVIPNIVV